MEEGRRMSRRRVKNENENEDGGRKTEE